MTLDAEAKLRARLLKLHTLAERGEPHERENAQRRLDALLEKNDIDIHQVIQDTYGPRPYVFEDLRDELECKLLGQVAVVIINEPDFTFGASADRRSVLLELTPVQYAEITVMFDCLRESWRTETERLYLAFIHRYDLFPECTRGEKSDTIISAEELSRMQSMMHGIDRVPVHRRVGTGDQLEGGSS